MRLRTRKMENGSRVHLAVLGRFDFSLRREFREALEEMAAASACTIDLKDVESMDSAALGMLVLAKKRCAQVRLEGCGPNVLEMLRVSGLVDRFNISD